MLSDLVVCSFTKNDIYRILYEKVHDNAYTSYLRGTRCKTEKDFFYEVSASFQFPWYFGENWAAFDECICDLEWLQFDSIVLVIDDFSAIFDGSHHLQSLLIKYLTVMIQYWENENIPICVYLNN